VRGWKEEEILDKRLMAPCGLYCGTCGVYLSNRDNNEKFRSILANLYGSKPEDTRCLGCMQDDPPECLYDFCKNCKLRDCIKEKGFYSCHQCSDWPCKLVEEFPLPVGRRVMKRAIPKWRELAAKLGDEEGSQAWARGECERYRCSHCGQPLFRGAITCRGCKRDVSAELDGLNR
jgi:uncharacterized protein DUF3795